MKFFLSILLLCTACVFPVCAELPKTLTLRQSLPLYAEPEVNAPMITTMEEGEKISVHPYENGWIKVDFSGTMKVWVASCFIKNGIYTEDVIFRTAPTAATSRLTIRNAAAGTKADIIGSDPSGYWKKVRLNFEFSGYVTRTDLEKCLVPAANRYRVKHFPIISTAMGKLQPLEKPVNQATHKLVYKVYEAEYLVAYVIPDKVNLKLWEDWMIYISGERFWSSSSTVPFVKGVNIFPAYR